MAWFLVVNIIVISAVVMLYLAVRALPRVYETKDGSPLPHDPAAAMDSFLQSGIPEKVDTFLRGIFEKMLRRVKIVVMKIDTFTTSQLNAIRSQTRRASVFSAHKSATIPDPTAVLTPETHIVEGASLAQPAVVEPVMSQKDSEVQMTMDTTPTNHESGAGIKKPRKHGKQKEGSEVQ